MWHQVCAHICVLTTAASYLVVVFVFAFVCIVECSRCCVVPMQVQCCRGLVTIVPHSPVFTAGLHFGAVSLARRDLVVESTACSNTLDSLGSYCSAAIVAAGNHDFKQGPATYSSNTPIYLATT